MLTLRGSGDGFGGAFEEVLDYREFVVGVAGDDAGHPLTEWAEDFAFDPRELVGGFDPHAAAVGGVGSSRDIAGKLEAVERER